MNQNESIQQVNNQVSKNDDERTYRNQTGKKDDDDDDSDDDSRKNCAPDCGFKRQSTPNIGFFDYYISMHWIYY